jgi:ABC-2 type transport system permease protein
MSTAIRTEVLTTTISPAAGLLVDLTPFEHVPLVPSRPFRADAAGVMLAIGAVAAVAAVGLLRRRDLAEL